MPSACRARSIFLLVLAFSAVQVTAGQTLRPNQPVQPQNQLASDAESELQTGTDLTRQGRFAEAIPHLLAARARLADNYAASFNLALCYVATRQAQLAIPILERWQQEKSTTPAVWNLSAQAYVANGQDGKALQAVQRAAQITPHDEKLYLYVADASTGAQDNALGLQVVDLGLRNLPRSAKLHYERAVFLSGLGQQNEAKKEFHVAAQLGVGSNIGYLAQLHELFIDGNVAEAVRVGREAVATGNGNYILLALFAQALLRSGVAPGDAGFAEAERAAEKSIAERGDYAEAHVTLGKLYLMGGQVDACIAQLKTAEQLDPRNAAVYSNLAAAFRRKGDMQSVREALKTLARLNQQQVIAIRESGTKTGERSGYTSSKGTQ